MIVCKCHRWILVCVILIIQDYFIIWYGFHPVVEYWCLLLWQIMTNYYNRLHTWWYMALAYKQGALCSIMHYNYGCRIKAKQEFASEGQDIYICIIKLPQEPFLTILFFIYPYVYGIFSINSHLKYNKKVRTSCHMIEWKKGNKTKRLQKCSASIDLCNEVSWSVKAAQ